MTLENAYRLLGASREDSNNEVKKKYHKLVLQYHPDKHIGGNVDHATKKMQEINAAYEHITKSRNNDNVDFDWGISVKVTYKKPTRPKGKTNKKANIARTTLGYNCDFWNLWSPEKERSSAFLTSLYSGIIQKIDEIRFEHDMLFANLIIERLTYCAAAEYVDPYVCLCERFNVTDLSEAVTIQLITKGIIDFDEGESVILSYDQSLLGQPYAISFSTVAGKTIGVDQSMESICVFLLADRFGASISGIVEDILTLDEYDFSLRKRIPTNFIKIRLHISMDQPAVMSDGFVNNYKKIKELLNYYQECGKFVNAFFDGRTYGANDVYQLYHNTLKKVERQDIEESPIYTLSYRVYERDTHEIDGSAQCNDITKFSILNNNEKELLCYIYAVTHNYDVLNGVSKGKSCYYQYDGENVVFIVRLYKQKNPNYGNGDEIKYWHNVKISIYPRSAP